MPKKIKIKPINNYGYVENELREILGTKVKISNKKMEIYFDSNKDL